MSGGGADDELSIEEMLSSRPAEYRAPGRLALGSMVDGWRVEAFLGEGRSAEVYRVVNLKGGGDGALKLLADLSPSMRERFAREVKVLKSVALPGMPKFLREGTALGSPYCIMEYLQPLFLPLPREDAVKFTTSLARSVGALNEYGFVHRDIKPANVLLRREGGPVLVDFGLVSAIPETRAAELGIAAPGRDGVGTKGFSAPEQMMDGVFNARTEVFALGKMLRAALTRPIPRPLLDVIRKATSDDPEDRYPNAMAFADAVEEAAGRRRRAFAFAAAGIAAVAAAVVAVLLVARRGPGSGAVAPTTPPPPPPPTRPVVNHLAPSIEERLLEIDIEKGAERLAARPGESDQDRFRRILEDANYGDLDAQTAVAEAYFWGKGVDEDKAKAVEWYRKAADEGGIDALASLGICLLKGYGCEEDHKAAVKCFAAAAAEKNVRAMNDYAFCLIHGKGTDKNEKAGFKLALEAAELGHAASQVMVGECYLYGWGVAKKAPQEARIWLEKAAAQGNKRARRLLDTRFP